MAGLLDIIDKICRYLDPGHFTEPGWYPGPGAGVPGGHVVALAARQPQLHLLHLLHLDPLLPGLLQRVQPGVSLRLGVVAVVVGAVVAVVVGADILDHGVGGEAGEEPAVRLQLHQRPAHSRGQVTSS